MPQDAVEFRSYRQALAAVAGAIIVLGTLYLLASIAFAVFRKHHVTLRGQPIHAENLDEVLACHTDVERLFREITERSLNLQGMAGQKDTDLAQQWESFSKQWHDDWSEVGERCRFIELRDRGQGTDFDRLAWAHADLEDMKLKFATLLHNYIDQQVPYIESIRRSLEASRRGLWTRKQNQPPQANGAEHDKVN